MHGIDLVFRIEWINKTEKLNRRLPSCILKSRSKGDNPIGVQLIKVIIFL